jgi:hypothetical protein
MNALQSRKPRFELSMEQPGRIYTVVLQFASSRMLDASTEIEAEIAVWVNEGGAGDEVRR